MNAGPWTGGPGRGDQPRPHLPLRPIWLCRSCALPWPCAAARLALAAEYAHDRVALSVYLCAVLHDAAGDLYRLNPHDSPDPAALFRRFLAWVPRLRADPDDR
ncbi:hypothetical protein [Micromonospora coxensis]|uniref:Flavin reductase n=1 Tax=Micromonospora coxensis TaxID=356852 RepID=A0A1C5IJ40_9ACTN|nr:hypothetical protein [Micromonospora coxensis]SCG58049.1 hypothetical protein GA0070614_2855 [Micromonospora coxensis]